MDHDYHNAIFMFMDSEYCLNICCFLQIYVAYHVVFYSVVENLGLYIKSIMTVWLISRQFQFYGWTYFKYVNNKLRSYLNRYTLVKYIIFSNDFLIRVFETCFNVLQEWRLVINSSMPIPDQPCLQTKFMYEQMTG